MTKIEEKTLSKINDLLQTLRVYINYDGGDVEFVSFIDGVLTLRMLGACAYCPTNCGAYDIGLKEAFTSQIKQIKDVKFIY